MSPTPIASSWIRPTVFILASALMLTVGIASADEPSPQAVPEAKVPVETLPGETMPGETMPVETLPVETFPEVTIRGSQHRQLESQVNGHVYHLYIKPPRGYESRTERYSVLYVLDAETNFGAVSYIVQRLIKDRLIPETLVVGIAYDVSYRDFYRLRGRDLTPVPGSQGEYGEGERFRDFIETELFPWVAKHYRVKEDDRTLYGHSLGGLFGFYALLSRPGLFQRYVLLSPSLWWADKAIFQHLGKPTGAESPTRLYVATGEHENGKHHGGQSMVDQHLEMVELLHKVPSSQLRIQSEILKGETHRTIFGTGLTRGLRFVYPRTQ
ncbi:MAG: alpha/beta hydrolase-fold protein [Acidobacteriota bacterium]